MNEMNEKDASMKSNRSCFRISSVVTLTLCALLIAVVGAHGPAAGAEKGDFSAVDNAKRDFGELKGRWLRPDGGYILAVKDIDPGGKIDAAYYNPRQINVSEAQATREGETLKVFIELRDFGYPGSTYTLIYDPKTDQLSGVYYQAAIRQRFDVFFVRAK
jgi:uncharacterized protein (DUF2147 family)